MSVPHPHVVCVGILVADSMHAPSTTYRERGRSASSTRSDGRGRRLCRRTDVPSRRRRHGRLHADELDPGLIYSGRALHVAGALVMPSLDGEPAGLEP